MADYIFTVLAPTHNVGAFSCGDAEIDEYLHKRAAAEQALNLCQVYVMADGASRAWAYGTLSPVSVTIDAGLLQAVGISQPPYRAVGGYLLGRLGVDGALQKRGIGRSVVARVARIAAQQRNVTGGVFLAVDAKSDWLVSWYEQLGFRRLDAKRRRLVLPLASLP